LSECDADITASGALGSIGDDAKHIEVAMSASGGTKRQRKRERAFLQFYDTLSLRAAMAAVGGSLAFLAWVAVRFLVLS
jgi:hypothetical protein